MRHFRRGVIAIALVTIGLCSWTGAQQVLDQAPSNAVGVLEIKDMQALSTKIAKLAKTLGIDQFQPQWADPLGAWMDSMGLKQGVNKNGDVAAAFINPKQPGAAEGQMSPDEPPMVVLVPVDDYKAFLGNFQDVKDAGDGISQVTVPKNSEKLFVIQRGKYAAAAMNKSLLANHDGFKLEGPAAKEAQTKDVILYFNMKSVRPQLQQAYKKGRTEIQKQLQGANPMGAKMNISPAMMAILDKAVGQFISDTSSLALTFNLNDVGLGTTFLSNFEADSYCGKLVSQTKNTDQPMLAGLPARTYLMFLGAVITPQVANQVAGDIIDAIKQNPGKTNPQDVSKYLDDAKAALDATQSVAGGLVAPEAGESFFQGITISHCQAHKIVDAFKASLTDASGAAALSGDQKVKTTIKMGDPTTVDGIQFQPYTMKFDFDANDPMAAQSKEVTGMLYGPNGLMGNIGAINDNTVLSVQGGSQKLLTDGIASAKQNADTLDDAASLKDVKAQLPRERAAEFYLALDNVASTAVKVMKQKGLAVQFRLPPNLPPIGATLGSEGSAARVDAFIPTKLVESMTAAVMQTIMQMNGGQGGGV